MLQPPFDLALSTLGFASSNPPRQIIEWGAGAGFRGILLDCARTGIRPRDLDRSARRGIASLFRRLELHLAGAELWIPHEHYASSTNSERALGATLSAIDLLAELASLVETDRTLTLTLPVDGAQEAVNEIAEAANRAEIRVANATWPHREKAGSIPIGLAIDPRAMSRAGVDPIGIITANQTPPTAARWAFASRRPEEMLDPLGYASALSVVGFQGNVALDLRDANEPQGEASVALARWRQSNPFH
jgi:hypothetical protein